VEELRKEGKVTVRQVALRLEVCNSTIYALVASGKLRCSRIGLGRGVIRISEEQLVEYLKGAEPFIAPAPPPARQIRLKHLRQP
jgi:excisionase family DNA binding protein